MAEALEQVISITLLIVAAGTRDLQEFEIEIRLYPSD